MITYTIKKAEKEGDEDIIVKEGQSHEFKMSDVQTHMIQLDKNVTSLKAQIELEEAKMKNVEENHPEVQEMEGIVLAAAAIYSESKSLRDKCVAKLKEVEDLIAEYTAEIEEIKKQTGI